MDFHECWLVNVGEFSSIGVIKNPERGGGAAYGGIFSSKMGEVFLRDGSKVILSKLKIKNDLRSGF